MGSDSDCIICGDQFEPGDRIVRMDVLRVVDHPGDPDAGWGSPFEGGLRPAEESPNRQYAHLDHIIEDQESDRTNARIIEPDEIDEDAEPDG